MKMKIQLRRSQIIGIVGLATSIFGLLYLNVILPTIVRHVVKKQVALKKGWPMREVWSKLPFVPEMHVYIFNITNHLKIGEGDKPIVREVGPFVYDIYQEKIDQVDHEEDDTVSYVARDFYHFNRFKSNGLSDELEVYFPHLFIMAVSNGPMKEKPPFVSWTSRAVDTILAEPISAFYRVKVRTALFDGFPIPCGGIDEYFGKLICNEIYERQSDYNLRRDGDTFYASVFGWMNGSYDKKKRIRIERGVKRLKNLGRVVEVYGKTNISTWMDDKCDAFDGTDATIFRPFLKSSYDVPIVYPLACRRLVLTYHSRVEFAGLKLLRYTTDLGTDGDHVPEEKCYCTTPDTCLKKGMFDTYRCLKVPIIVSNPHFYKADPYYLTTIDTLAPDEDKHMLYVDFDPLSGMPARVHIRMQFNFELFPIEMFRLAKNYGYSMLPLVWIDMVTVLPEFFLKEMRMGQTKVKIARAFGYILVIVGLVVVAFAACKEYKWKSDTNKLRRNPTNFEGTSANNSLEQRNPKIIQNMRAAKTPDNRNNWT